MNNIVIINAVNLSKYAFMELWNGKNSVELAVAAADSMPGVKAKAVILAEDGNGSELFDGFSRHKLDTSSPQELIRVMASLSEGFDNIIYYCADCPLVDVKLTEKMFANHVKYFCEYTFADGYPMGLSVEILKTSIIPMLAALAEDSEEGIRRNTVFSLIEKDINAFEIETEISPDDQRLLRVGLYPDTGRNYLQLKSITEEVKKYSGTDTAEQVLQTVRSRGEFLRSLPAFFEFETTASHPQQVKYLPEVKLSGGTAPEISLTDFNNVLSKISDFCDDAVISLSIRNEPSLHSSPSSLAAAVLSYPGLSLLVETSGIGWNKAEVEKILSMDSKRITWIVDLDALDPDLYKSLRGGDKASYDEAYRFAGDLLSASPSNCWVQVVRMKENEEDTELFYKYWKEKTNNVIIQKYDWCCGRLEQRKVTDLSPVKRLPCWHLKREIAVLTDGTVPLCRDDLDCEMVCGNIFTDHLADIWNNGREYYRQHLQEEYPGICRNCDEYYTYNY